MSGQRSNMRTDVKSSANCAMAGDDDADDDDVRGCPPLFGLLGGRNAKPPPSAASIAENGFDDDVAGAPLVLPAAAVAGDAAAWVATAFGSPKPRGRRNRRSLRMARALRTSSAACSNEPNEKPMQCYVRLSRSTKKPTQLSNRETRSVNIASVRFALSITGACEIMGG